MISRPRHSTTQSPIGDQLQTLVPSTDETYTRNRTRGENAFLRERKLAWAGLRPEVAQRKTPERAFLMGVVTSGRSPLALAETDVGLGARIKR
jgi:hypothetical protein